jgi:hypothetical protein
MWDSFIIHNNVTEMMAQHSTAQSSRTNLPQAWWTSLTVEILNVRNRDKGGGKEEEPCPYNPQAVTLLFI